MTIFNENTIFHIINFINHIFNASNDQCYWNIRAKIDLPNNLLESEEFKPDWQKLNVSNSPSARDLTPLVYDSINKKTILFGGYTLVIVIRILGFLIMKP